MAVAGNRSRPDGVIGPDGLSEGATQLGLHLEPAQLARLVQFAELLQRWNRVHNLTALGPRETLAHHLLDSLSVVPTIVARRPVAATEPLRVLDVGAGGGLPGVPLAIAAPQVHVTLLDKVAKKAAFLQQVKVELALHNAEVVNARVESIHLAPFDVIVARAFASLTELVRLTRPLLAAGGCWCAMKGVLPREEIAALEAADPGVRVSQVVKLHVPRLDAERHLVLIEPL